MILNLSNSSDRTRLHKWIELVDIPWSTGNFGYTYRTKLDRLTDSIFCGLQVDRTRKPVQSCGKPTCRFFFWLRLDVSTIFEESINSGERNYRRLLDADALGNTPSDGSKPYEPPPARFNPGSNGELVHCAEVVAKGDYEWRIDGMSWLVNALQQNECPSLESCAFIVGGEEFTLQYNPKCGDVGDLGGQRGSLCLVHQDEGGITFRYRALIKNAAGSYVQWGPEGNECYPAESTCGRAFGPDVYFVEDMDDSNHQVRVRERFKTSDQGVVFYQLKTRSCGIYC